MCVRERERNSVCVCAREREREKGKKQTQPLKRTSKKQTHRQTNTQSKRQTNRWKVGLYDQCPATVFRRRTEGQTDRRTDRGTCYYTRNCNKSDLQLETP